jgi:P4 family phage/plasmid primase-like protien
MKNNTSNVIRLHTPNIEIDGIDSDIIDWIESIWQEKKQCYKYIVKPPFLSRYIRTNAHYFFVRNDANSSVMTYWYKEGVYSQITDQELEGHIKSFIPFDLYKSSDIKEVLNDLKTDLKFIHNSDLNSDENIINFKNGLLNLDTMEIEPHSPSVYSTIQINSNYIKSILTPEHSVFDNFIKTLTNNNDEIKSLLLQFLGFAISNIKGFRTKKALFLQGEGDTGKSQLKKLAEKLVGENNTSSVDLKTLEDRFGTSSIYNKRIVGSNDMKYASISEISTFKSLTGGDSVLCEFKGQQQFNFTYSGLLWFCCNELPKFGGDKGDWVYERMILVKCDNVIPVEKQNPHIVSDMLKESEYIIYLALQELKKVIDNKYKFIIPESCIENRTEYKQNNDSVMKFYAECITDRPKKFFDNCTKKVLYDVYKAWCKDNNKGYSDTKQQFNESIKKLGLDEEFKDSKGNRYYKLITLNIETKREYQDVYGMDSAYSN